MSNNICQTCTFKNGCEDYCENCSICGNYEAEQSKNNTSFEIEKIINDKWQSEIDAWQERIKQKYTKQVEHENWEGKIVTVSVFELPEQDITIEYNGKPLIHVNGNYTHGCIRKAMAKTFTGKGKKRIEVEEIEA